VSDNFPNTSSTRLRISVKSTHKYGSSNSQKMHDQGREPYESNNQVGTVSSMMRATIRWGQYLQCAAAVEWKENSNSSSVSQQKIWNHEHQQRQACGNTAKFNHWQQNRNRKIEWKPPKTLTRSIISSHNSTDSNKTANYVNINSQKQRNFLYQETIHESNNDTQLGNTATADSNSKVNTSW